MRRLVVIPAVAAALALSTSGPSRGEGIHAQASGPCASAFRSTARLLADPGARTLSTRPRRTTVRALRRIARPLRLRATGRVGAERSLFRVRARLVSFIAAEPPPRGDGSIELVVAGPRGAPLSVVFPHPECVVRARALRPDELVAARSALVAACGEPPTTHFARLRGTAEVVAPAFFGARPARKGVPPNGIELAPALSFLAFDCRRRLERPAVVAAAGDIACAAEDPAFNGGAGRPTRCRMAATADVVEAIRPDAVLALGDLQYGDASLAAFRSSYDLFWGRFRAITRPVVGNHEYASPRAAGFFAYFGRGVRRGYYSFDLGAWHLVALDSNCGRTGWCRPGSQMLRWLRADLAAHRNRCVLAYWHSPLFSSGQSGGDRRVKVLWDALFAAGADVVLAGHDHNYERLAPLTPAGAVDARRGIRQFVVGTGGRSLLRVRTPVAGSEARDNTTFGVLRLTLHPTSYEWGFVPVPGGAFTDAGSGLCH